MDFFPVGSFVRLRSRARDKYVHADEDGIHVSLCSLGAANSLNAVWKVDLWPVEGGGNLLLLQGAAYGRYLAVAHEDEVVPRGYRGVRAVQRDYDLPHEDPPLMWTAVRMEADQNYVRLHNNEQRCLGANGKHRRWKNRVTVDVRNGDETTMMQWAVEGILSTPEPIPLPPPPQPPRRGLFRRRTEHPGRRIWHFRLKDDGNPVTDDWPDFVFHDYSMSNLRTEVARLEHDENITLGVRAGYNARVIPLVTNLPNNTDPMQIIVYTTGSPAAAALRYPHFLSARSVEEYESRTFNNFAIHLFGNRKHLSFAAPEIYSNMRIDCHLPLRWFQKIQLLFCNGG